MVNNKKAQVAATLTWVIAFLIIFFVMLLFITATIILSEKKVFTGKEEITFEGYAVGGLEAHRYLINFLNTPTEFNEEMILVKDLVADEEDDPEKLAKWKELAGQFLETEFPGQDVKVHRWFRIYDVNDEIISEYGRYFSTESWEKYKDYKSFARYGYVKRGCDPKSSKSISSYIVTSPNKKIALCVEYF